MKGIIFLVLFATIGYSQNCVLDIDELCVAIQECGLTGDPDTDISAVGLTLSGNTLTSSVTEDGVTLSDNVTLPTGTDDQRLTYDANTKRLTIEDGNFVDLDVMPTWTTITAPDITVTGTATETSEQVLETDTEWYTQQDGDCREKYTFQYRIRLNQTDANGWANVRVPNITGWDRRVYDLGTYRQTGNINNPGDDNFGAMPDAPYMGAEAHEWSNTGIIYLNQFNSKDNGAASMWVEFIVEYKRN